MDEFFNALKETRDVEKSFSTAECHLKNMYEEIKGRQENEMLTEEEAEQVFTENLKLIIKYERIKVIETQSGTEVTKPDI